MHRREPGDVGLLKPPLPMTRLFGPWQGNLKSLGLREEEKRRAVFAMLGCC